MENNLFTTNRSHTTINDNNKFLEYYFRVRFKRKRIECTYLIDGVYVGSSVHLRERLLHHSRIALNHGMPGNPFSEYLREKLLNNKPLKLQILSYEKEHEDSYIKENYSKLLNVNPFGFGHVKVKK